MRERASSSEKGSSIRIPRHAPSYHIDLAIVTILSSPAMLGCTIAAGGRGMPKSEESRAGEGQREERMETARGRGSRSYRMVVPRHPDARMWAAEGWNASESAKQSALLDEEKRESRRRGQKVYVTRTRARARGSERRNERWRTARDGRTASVIEVERRYGVRSGGERVESRRTATGRCTR